MAPMVRSTRSAGWRYRMIVGAKPAASNNPPSVAASNSDLWSCGSHSFGARSRFRSGRHVPQSTRVPTAGSPCVYRYTHGEPEVGTLVDWGTWRPDRNLDRAPKEWLPQLHKSLFDAATLGGLFEAAGLAPTIIRYRHPADRVDLTIGAIAGHH